MAAAFTSPAALTLLAAASLTVMANATIAPSLPALADHFGGTAEVKTLAGLAMTFPSAAVAATALIAGAVADRFGKRRLLVIALVLYALAGASGLVLASLEQILVGRLLLGLGVAGTMTASTALVADLFTGRERETFMGVQGAAMSVGGILFLVTGGVLAGVHWRAPFALYLAAFAVLAAVLMVLPKPTERAAGATGEAGGTLPFGLVAGIAAISAFTMVTFYMIPVKLPFLLRELGAPSPLTAGLSVAACTLTSALAAMQYGRVRGRFSPPAIFAASFAAMAVGYALIGVAGSVAGVVAGALVAGLGLGLQMPTQAAWLLSVTPPGRRGLASGVLTTAVFVGQFLSPLAAGPLSAAIGLSATYLVAAGALAVVAAMMTALSLAKA